MPDLKLQTFSLWKITKSCEPSIENFDDFVYVYILGHQMVKRKWLFFQSFFECWPNLKPDEQIDERRHLDRKMRKIIERRWGRDTETSVSCVRERLSESEKERWRESEWELDREWLRERERERPSVVEIHNKRQVLWGERTMKCQMPTTVQWENLFNVPWFDWP